MKLIKSAAAVMLSAVMCSCSVFYDEHTSCKDVPEDMDKDRWEVPYKLTDKEIAELKYTPEYDYYSPQSSFVDIDAFYGEWDTEPWLSVVAFSNGSVHGSQTGMGTYPDESYAYIGNDKYTSVKHYYPAYEDISGITYKMADNSEWPLAEAVEYVESLYNEKLAGADVSQFTYYVERADIIPLGQERAGYYFFLNFSDKDGRRFDGEGLEGVNSEENCVYRGERFLLYSEQSAYCCQKGKVTSFDKDFSFTCENTGTDNERLISLERACRVLSDTLGENMKLDFDTAELSYVFTCDKYPKDEIDGVMEYSRFYCLHSCDIYARPYWIFRADTRGEFENWRNSVNYYIDAVTGEFIMVRFEQDG